MAHNFEFFVPYTINQGLSHMVCKWWLSPVYLKSFFTVQFYIRRNVEWMTEKNIHQLTCPPHPQQKKQKTKLKKTNKMVWFIACPVENTVVFILSFFFNKRDS